MTTICYKSGVLAFDSKVSGDGVGWVVKGVKTKHHLAAACGELQDAQAFLDWIEAGGVLSERTKYGLDKECEMSGISISKKGTVFLYESKVYPFKYEAPFIALGSGCQYAIGAMAFGATASQAIRIASKFDLYTGGTIRELKWK